MASDSEDDMPLQARQKKEETTAPSTSKPAAGGRGAGPGAKPKPPVKSNGNRSNGAPQQRKRKAGESDDDDESSSSESGDESGSDAEEEGSSDDDVPLHMRVPKATPPPGGGQKRKKPASGRKDSKRQRSSSRGRATSAEPGGKSSGAQMWKTLRHAGVLFPPEYVPHGVKMKYEGRDVELTPDQEEVATMFAVMKETDYMQKPVFLKNFWEGFQEVLGKNHTIKSLDKCDFTPMFDWHMAEREKKKTITKEVRGRQAGRPP